MVFGTGVYVVGNTVHDCAEKGIYGNGYENLDLPVYVYNNTLTANAVDYDFAAGLDIRQSDPGPNPHSRQSWHETTEASERPPVHRSAPASAPFAAKKTMVARSPTPLWDDAVVGDLYTLAGRRLAGSGTARVERRINSCSVQLMIPRQTELPATCAHETGQE